MIKVSHKYQKGVALITVLVIVALLTPLMTKLMLSQQLLVKKSAAGAHFNNATMYALAMETLGRQMLQQDAKESKHDGLNEAWAGGGQKIEGKKYTLSTPVDGGLVEGNLIDLQGLYNVNNFNKEEDTGYKEHFWKLCDLLEIDKRDAEALVQSLEDWMDVDNKTTVPYGAEDLDYGSLELPYRAGQRPLVSVSELLLLRGMKPDVWEKLAPFITALPAVDLKINVNTAPKEILYSLFPEKAKPVIDDFIELRKGSQGNPGYSFTKLSDFLKEYRNLVGEDLPEEVQEIIGVSSNYFKAEIRATFGSGQVEMQSLLVRDVAANVKVLFRSFGSL